MSLACFAHVTPLQSKGTLAEFAPRRRRITQCSRQALRADRWLASAVTVQQPVEQLQSWADRHKKQLQNSRVDAQEQTAVLATSTSAQSGQSLLSVPDSSWLSLQVVAKSEIGSAVSSLEPWLQLAIYILYGLSQRNSEWSQYLHALPTVSNVPLLWSEDELDEIEGTQLLSTVQGYRDFFEDRWRDLNDNLFSTAPNLFPADQFSFERFLWATATLRAHVHPPLQGSQVALVPLADLVQHARKGNSQWKLQQAGFGRKQSLLVESTIDLPAGTPLTMDYGPDRTDGQLLLDYGVLDAGSPKAGFLLPLAIPEGDKCYDDKADTVELNGLQEASEFLLRPDKPPSNELVAFLRLINVSGPDAFLMEALFRNEVWNFMQMPVSKENEQAVCKSMVDGCREALRGYKTSINEDLALLREEQLSPRHELAVRVRLGEKETLDVTMRYFEDRMSKLHQLEYYQERRLKGLGLLDDEGNNTWDDFFKDSIA